MVFLSAELQPRLFRGSLIDLVSQVTKTLVTSLVCVSQDWQTGHRSGSREFVQVTEFQMIQVCSELSLMRKLKSPSAFFLYGIPKNSAIECYNIPLVSICSQPSSHDGSLLTLVSPGLVTIAKITFCFLECLSKGIPRLPTEPNYIPGLAPNQKYRKNASTSLGKGLGWHRRPHISFGQLYQFRVLNIILSVFTEMQVQLRWLNLTPVSV